MIPTLLALALFLQGGGAAQAEETIRQNELSIRAELYYLSTAEHLFKYNDIDGDEKFNFWVRDVAGLCYTLNKEGTTYNLIPPRLALADRTEARGKYPNMPPGKPVYGYFVVALKRYQEYGKSYALDRGQGLHDERFAFVAVPEVYGKTGKNSFLVTEEQIVFQKDIPKPPAECPQVPEDAGWVDAETAEMSKPQRMEHHERQVTLMLSSLVRSNLKFRVDDSDADGKANFWVKDVAGLHSALDQKKKLLKLIPFRAARADKSPGKDVYAEIHEPVPCFGYYVSVLNKYSKDGKAMDLDDGTGRSERGVAYVAYPAEYGKTGIHTYVVMEGLLEGFDAHLTLRKDTNGAPPKEIPLDYDKEVWTPVR